MPQTKYPSRYASVHFFLSLYKSIAHFLCWTPWCDTSSYQSNSKSLGVQCLLIHLIKLLANSLPPFDYTFFIRCNKHNLCPAFRNTTLIALVITLPLYVTIVPRFCQSPASTNCFKTQIKEDSFSWTTRVQPNVTMLLWWLIPTSTTSGLLCALHL